MRTILSAVLLLTFSFGCGDTPAIDVSAVPFKGQPIFGGSLPDDDRYDAVVGMYITLRNGTFICSGTLIAPRVVLSAAHCVVSGRGRRMTVAAPSDITVFLGPALGDSPEAVSEVLVHPGYDPRALGVNDLSLLRLVDDAAVPPIDTLPASMANLETVGTPVIFAGYGLTEDGDIGTKLWVGGELSDVTSTGLRNEQDDLTGTCGGDSGGPLIYDFGGTWYVGGTTSWGDSACTDYGWSMRVSAFESWIDAF